MRTPETQARLAMLEANIRAQGFTGQFVVVGKGRKHTSPYVEPPLFRCWPDWVLLALVVSAIAGVLYVAF